MAGEFPTQFPSVPQASIAAEVAPTRRGALVVAAGIFCSRVIGLLRNSLVAHYFGVGPHVDVLNMALRAPNLLQNLLGEGTLSASFIPIYSRMIHEERPEEAGRFAGAVFGLLAASAGALALAGVVLAEPITAVLAMGFLKDRDAAVNRFDLTVAAVRIIFPMTAFLVLAAWALGVLNSHRRFFLPYFAPALWNIAIITALVWTGGWGAELSNTTLDRLLFAACWGAFLGGVLQFAVQLPLVTKLIRGFRLSLSLKVTGVREALRAFGPVLAGRGVVQVAGYLDYFLAGFLAAGAVAALGFAQVLYLLPVSLFGMSVAAAELPDLARVVRKESGQGVLPRIRRALRQTAFLNAPTLIGYLVFGHLLVSALFRRGTFDAQDTWLVYLVLCGYSLGLLASTSSRLLQNTFYALGETRVPARIAMARVGISAGLGLILMLMLDRYSVTDLVGIRTAEQPLRLGAVGLALASGLGAWLELLLLQRALASRITGSFLPWYAVARMVGLAGFAAVPAAGLWWLLPSLYFVWAAFLVVGTFAAGYLLLARFTEAEELGFWIGKLGRKSA